MALNIRNPEAEKLAEALVRLTGETKTDAVTKALQDRPTRVRRERARLLDALVERAGIDVVGVDLEQGALARRAFTRYGKGRRPAGLNFGDCFAYALAQACGESLLFKGNDFRQTDIFAAVDG